MFTLTTPLKFTSAMFQLTCMGMQMQMSAYRALGNGLSGAVEPEKFASRRPPTNAKGKATATKPSPATKGKKRTRQPAKPPVLPDLSAEKGEEGLNNLPV